MDQFTLDEQFWSDRYSRKETGWDIGYISPPIKEYINQIPNKDLKILIPGGGNSYEAEYLLEQGFTDVSVVDISILPLKNIQRRIPSFPKNKLIHQDFFTLEGQYDLILEQTFFCALNPSLRGQYVLKMHNLLKPDGKLVGLLFNIPLNDHKPPFGGNEKEYRALFNDTFIIEKMEPAYNSIPPRAGNELFIKFIRKED